MASSSAPKAAPSMKKQSAGEETRNRILDAAEQVFSEKGFASTGTREIARLAGIDKFAIFYHFKNKEALYREVIERSFSQMTRFIDQLFPREILSADELERTFERLLEYLGQHTAILKIMQRESLDRTNVDISEIFQKYFKPLFRKGIQFTERGKRNDVFHQDLNSRQFIASLYTMIMSYYTDGAMIGLLLGEDALSRKMIRERKTLLAKFVVDNLVQEVKP